MSSTAARKTASKTPAAKQPAARKTPAAKATPSRKKAPAEGKPAADARPTETAAAVAPAGPVFPALAIDEGRDTDVMAYVYAGGDINARPSEAPYTLLIEAIRSGRKPIFDWLLEWEADPNGVDFGGNSALHHAAGLGLPYHVEELLARAANHRHRNRGGLTCLHHAARCRRTGSGPGDLPAPDKASVIRLLLDAGADPLARDQAKRDALTYFEGCPNQDGRELVVAALSRASKSHAALLAAVQQPTAKQAWAGAEERIDDVDAFLAKAVAEFKAARGKPEALEQAIVRYLDAGAALRMGSFQLRNYFDVSSPGLLRRAGYSAEEAEQGSEVFSRVSKARSRA